MQNFQTCFDISTNGPGLYEFTGDITRWMRSTGLRLGQITLFVRHTSCSLLVQENADPDVQTDLQNFFARLVPRSDDPKMRFLRHTIEGPDDMPAHIKSAVMPVSITIPIADGQILLGTWQGLYLFEHRDRPRTRQVVFHLAG